MLLSFGNVQVPKRGKTGGGRNSVSYELSAGVVEFQADGKVTILGEVYELFFYPQNPVWGASIAAIHLPADSPLLAMLRKQAG